MNKKRIEFLEKEKANDTMTLKLIGLGLFGVPALGCISAFLLKFGLGFIVFVFILILIVAFVRKVFFSPMSHYDDEINQLGE